MSDVAAVAATVVGAAVVLLTLRDVFHELFHPSGSGSISAMLRRVLWRGFRAASGDRRARLALAGPSILVLTIATWAGALAVGWALVVWPQLPAGFRFASPLVGGAEQGFDSALYVSFVALTTLGFGDVTPTTSVLRLVVALEAAVGFVLLTAGISWIQSVYPVLSRRRTLAERLHAVRLADERSAASVAQLEPTVSAAQLTELAAGLATANVDLVQTGITYAFVEVHDRSALAAQLPYALRLADAGIAGGDAPAVRHAAHQLRAALDEYAWTVRTAHLHLGERPLAEVLAAYAADHGRGADA